jgi:hypothetical protein
LSSDQFNIPLLPWNFLTFTKLSPLTHIAIICCSFLSDSWLELILALVLTLYIPSHGVRAVGFPYLLGLLRTHAPFPKAYNFIFVPISALLLYDLWPLMTQVAAIMFDN